MPDTLDLAQHARLAVNALTSLGPDYFYACSQMFCFGVEPPDLGKPNWSCMLKYLRALPLMRAISGSAQNLDVEEQTMQAVLNQVSTDGLLSNPTCQTAFGRTTYPGYVNGLKCSNSRYLSPIPARIKLVCNICGGTVL